MRLGLDGAEAMLALLETSHLEILEALQPFWLRGTSPLAPAARLAYRAGRALNGVVARGLRLGLSALPPIPPQAPGGMVGPWRDVSLAALNGVVGDHLDATGNPLALGMGLRHKGRLLVPEDPGLETLLGGAGDHLLVMVHGLCMADVFWNYYGHHHGRFLGEVAGVTAIGVSYNTGRHISANGRDLAHLVARLAAYWPGRLRRISFIGYSMGGLVARACIAAARAKDMDWLDKAGHAIYLGAPHHGAPLERGGHWLQSMAALNPFMAPLARLARLRSAGITDLRHGNIAEEDRAGVADRFHVQAGLKRRAVPLDPVFRHHAVAATLGRRRGDAADRLLGDGLVMVDSAFGAHPDPVYDLGLGPEDRLLVRQTGHLDLLASRPVAKRMADWLST